MLQSTKLLDDVWAHNKRLQQEKDRLEARIQDQDVAVDLDCFLQEIQIDGSAIIFKCESIRAQELMDAVKEVVEKIGVTRTINKLKYGTGW